MSKLTKSLTAAAGNAGGESLYAEDVFSTYLYDGTGATQVIENGIALGDSNYGSSVEFDGVADYVSRGSGLSGQSDSHTFTLSVWVFNAVPSGFARILGIKNSSGSNNILYLQIDSNNYLNVMTLTDGVSQIQGISASNSPPGYTVPPNQWSNILISANLATSTWHLSINDSYTSVTPYKPSGYTDAIAFSTSSGSTVGTLYGSYFKGRITQLYLDNTFRDLSQTSVRRTFINSDGTPATGLASLNPVLYLPLDDTNSVGANLGTGGAYSVSGSPTQLSEGGPYIESGFGKGGLVWTKDRERTQSHALFDTERGVNQVLLSNTTAQSQTVANSLTSFNSDGFTLGGVYNGSGYDIASWTFRKAEKFFDVVTYTGTGNAATQINHSLNSIPGAIIVKKTSATGNWSVYHSYLGTGKYLRLEQYFGDTSDADYFPEVTDSYFRPGSDNHVNESGQSFVAYFFASDAGGFGDDGDESIIKCGSYTGTGSATPVEVNVGFEPQFVIVKSADFGNSDTDWFIIDTMRGFTFNPSTNYEFQALRANESSAESGQGRCGLTSTGFAAAAGDATGASGRNYIYIAIRRPMKTPESGTEVFATDTLGGTLPNPPAYYSGFAADWSLSKRTSSTGDWFVGSRLTQGNYLKTNTTDAEVNEGTPNITAFDYSTGVRAGTTVNSGFRGYMFKRATGFFDVVAYTGDGSGTRQIPHNLGAVPQLMITKARNSVELWRIGYTAGQIFTNWGSTGYAWVSNGNIYGDGTQWVDPTASYVTTRLNTSGRDYIQYLFGTLAGVSKVGSYTGNGTTQNIECGFSGGARFVMVWNQTNPTLTYVWDSERGIITGSPDPRIAINSTGAEFTTNDALNAYAGGFGVTSSTVANRNGDTYIFMAIS